MIRVFVVDDHAVVRQGVQQLLAGQPDIEVVGEASDGWGLLRALERMVSLPGVVTLDLSMPQLSGIETLRRLREGFPTVRVVVLSMYSADHHAARLMQQGAAAYVAKDGPGEHLIAAVRAVAAGKSWAAPSGHGGAPSAEGEPPRHAALSPREYQVFTLIFQGASVTDIAAQLNISVSTTSNHLAKVREKLGVKTVAALVRYACDAGLIDPGSVPLDLKVSP
jgi:DNA-binding NarL/FixJ family response regulator